MLEVQHPVDSLKKEREVNEPVEGEQHTEQISKPHEFKRNRRVDAHFSTGQQELQLPENFKIEKAVDEGDCFFDSFRQGLEQQKGIEVTVKQLREDCRKFARSSPPEWFINTIANSHDNNGEVCSETPNSYIGNILNSNRWGDPEVEGRILCQEYNVRLHVAEKAPIVDTGWIHQIVNKSGSRSIHKINYNEANTIHIVNGGRLHFQPILKTRNTAQVSNIDEKDENAPPKNEQGGTSHSKGPGEETLNSGGNEAEGLVQINVPEDHINNNHYQFGLRQEGEESVSQLERSGPSRVPIRRTNKVAGKFQLIRNSSENADYVSDSDMEIDASSPAESTMGATENNPDYENELSSKTSTLTFEPQSRPSDCEIMGKATVFTKAFVKSFEQKLSKYSAEAEPGSKIRKSGKTMDQIDSVVKDAVPVSVLNIPGPRLVANLIVKGVSYSTAKDHREKAKKISGIIDSWSKDKGEIRRILVEAALEIFQKFEEPLADIVDVGSSSVSREISGRAVVAVERVMNYLSDVEDEEKEKESAVNLITKGVVSYTVSKSTSIISRKALIGLELYQQAGIEVMSPTIGYFEPKKYVTSQIWGYRGLFQWELKDWPKVKEKEYNSVEMPKKQYLGILDEKKKKNYFMIF